MPILGRLFAKKNKIAPRAEILDDDNAHSPTFATESNDSTVSSYVTPDISVPSHPNAKNLLRLGQGSSTSPDAASGSGGGLRLFRRKKASPTELASSTLDLSNRSEFDTSQRSVPPRPSDPGTDPADLRRLRPPPSRSAIFAAYADPGSSLSTRSLPESTHRSSLPLLSSSPSPSPSPPQKRPSLFGWAKPSSRSNTGNNVDVSLSAPIDCSDLPPDRHSFNLKSFRHVGSASSPPPLPNAALPLPPPIPRPRLHSDSSQRISVAAFREAQARRSQTGSPVPSSIDLTPPSTRPASTAMKHGAALPGHAPRLSRSSAALLQNSRQSRSSIAIASTTDEDNSSSETDSEGESVYMGKPRHRPRRKAQSELGHGSKVTESSFKRAIAPRPSASYVGHATSRPLTNFGGYSKKPDLPSRSQSSLGLYESPKLKPVASTTPLNTPVVRQKRSSSISSNVTRSTARKVTPPQVPSNSQATRGKVTVGPPPRDSDSDSEDNAPLATFIAPKRPGSAASSYSNPRSVSGQTSRSAGHAKPLIDVNQVISSKPTSVVSSPPSDAAFTHGPTLLSAAKATTVHASSPLVSNLKLADDDCEPWARKVPPVKFVPPSSQEGKEMKDLVTSSLDEGVDLEKGFVPPSGPFSQKRGPGPEQEKRDPLSDRLTRVVKKSLTNPTNSGSTSSPAISQSLEGPTSRLSIATLSDSSQTYGAARITLPRSPPPVIQPSKDEYSPPDEELADLLGSVGIKLISRTGESDETSNNESSEEEKQKDEDRIAPIPIKQRTPPPAFAVTSRPAFPKQQEQGSKSSPPEVKNLPRQVEGNTPVMARSSDYPGVRQRSSTMVASSSSSSFPSTTASPSTRDSKVSSYLTSPSATDVSTKSTSSTGHTGVSLIGADKTTGIRPALGVKQRSSTMMAAVPLSSQMPRHFHAPDRRFGTLRGNSPSSSTGSSSGRVPHTPRDSGEICAPEDQDQRPMSTTKTEERSRGFGTKRQNSHAKRRSVSFEDDIRVLNTQPSKSHGREAATAGSDANGRAGMHVRESARAGPDRDLSDEQERAKEKEREKEKEKEEKRKDKDKEERRKERRRQEAHAAIELGNVMHGPPPVLDDDNHDMPTNPTMNPRLSAFNPMMVMNPMNMPMNYNASAGSGGWVPSMAQPMLSPAQFMIPRPADPSMMSAHQQAMMVAKQAYQMAVAQQAMAAAAEEWERGSALGGFGSRSSVYSGTSMMNAPPTTPGMMPGMSMVPGMQGNPAAAMWSSSSSLYGMGAVPRFGNYLFPSDVPFSSSRSDHGHSASSRTSGNWSTSKSMYGESFGPPHDSRKATLQQQTWNAGHLPPVPPIPSSKNMTPEPRGPSRLRTVSQPATPSRNVLTRKAIPPSSWRPSGS